tara:strand:- start:218 stop:571 length:354 start_codon:yes stop_codon:yes gene_type:complete
MIKKTSIIFGIICALVVSGCSITGGTVVSSNPDSLAKCLTSKGVTMYGTDWCSHCKNQKAAFGSSFGSVNYVDCDLSPSKCNAAGIQGYPTWKVMGKNYAGEQKLSRLASLTGCSYK